MRAALFVVSILIMIVTACDKPESILPKPPDTEEIPGQVSEESPAVSDSVSRDTTESQQPIPEDTTSVQPDSTIIAPDTTVVKPDSTSVEPKPDTTSTKDDATYQAGKSNDMPYRILLPKNFDAKKKYPLLVFLHGIGESGTDNKKQLAWGASLFQQDSIRKKYEAIIVFPQCHPSYYWFNDWGLNNLKGMIDLLQDKYVIDKNRIYIGGLSMGAYGTYAMVAEFPDLFAAAVAISGDGEARKADVMAKIDWRIFAGGRDEIVSFGKSEKMVKALEKAGASVDYTLYPNADHAGSWILAFEEPDFCSWIFSKSKER